MTHPERELLQRSSRRVYLCLLATGIALSACSAEPSDLASEQQQQAESFSATQAAFSTDDPTFICNQDPRVWSGLVSLEVCVGARVFFDETFDGNGRTCASCHPVANNFTIDPPFIETVDDTDPLFVAEHTTFDLEGLETGALRSLGGIKENLDGFEDNANKFVTRGVPHLFAMTTTIDRDPTDGTTANFVERTGWSGDGAPGDGSLRQFVNGAIIQHYPTDLGRTEDVSFRLATEAELDQVLAFQLALGRTNDIDLSEVQLSDADAAEGQALFVDPNAGRCNHCHDNGGGNFLVTGLNANFNTAVELFTPGQIELPTFNGQILFDGGFGGQGLATPNFSTRFPNDSFGDGTFNTPPVIEAADTGPFFHNNSFGSIFSPFDGIEGVVNFYTLQEFNNTPIGQALAMEFNGPITLNGDEITKIGRFLRVLNVALNLDMAAQRMNASKFLNVAYWDYRKDIQHGLLELAREEIDDALGVMQAVGTPTIHPTAQAKLTDAKASIAVALSTPNAAVRSTETSEALTDIQAARAELGTGINFQLGEGNLMF